MTGCINEGGGGTDWRDERIADLARQLAEARQGCHRWRESFVSAATTIRDLAASEADLQSQLAAQRERDGRELAEANRQLALYRKAINKMDDMTEYARPGLSREELRAIFAELTVALVPVPGGE